MKTRIGIVLLMAVLVVVAIVAIRRGGSAQAPSSPAAVIRIGIQNNVVCALPLITSRLGLFQREGLDVRIVPYPSGKLALAAMLAGDVDVAASADIPIVGRSLERDDFAIFATIAWSERGAWITARRDRGIERPADLRGKTIGTQRGSAVHFFLSAFLARHAIPETEVALVFLPAAELPAALANGQIDAFSMRNPFAAQAKALLGETAVELHDRDVYRQTFNLVAWKDALRDRRPVFAALLRALASAEQRLIHQPDEALAAVITELGLRREVEIRADWPAYTYVLSLDQSLFATLEEQAAWYIARDAVPGKQIPNYLLYVDTGPMLEVKPAAVSVIR